MITVKLYGMMREDSGISRLEVQAGTVREACAQIVETGVDGKRLRSCVMFVNGRPLQGANRLSTRMRDGDELAILSPVGGG